MGVFNRVEKLALDKMIDQLYKNPQKNLPKTMDWVDRFASGSFESQRSLVRDAITNPNNPYYDFIGNIFENVDKNVAKTLTTNFFLNAVLASWPTQEEKRQEHGCNIPWAILLDPTTACNLKCTGCWAVEYGDKLSLSYDEMDSIIDQGKDLGIYMYIYTGGEPLIRKKDIIKLCRKHDDCIFLAFTNGTLIDEDFADEMLEVGNFVPAISLEGSQEATDSRRGDGTYNAVIEAINILRDKKLVYGISSCYTSENIDSLASEEFYDYLVDLGVYFIWYFHYMPVGNGAQLDLLPRPEQRIKLMENIRKFRREKPLFAIDFQNDAQYVDGCIAGGRRYLHINSNGDVEPCVFIHYSDANIKDMPLLDALKSPLFMEYHNGQPFNDNMLRPCPMLENPDKINSMVHKTGAKSTDLESVEPVDNLCQKCQPYSKNWKPYSEDLWYNKIAKENNL